MKIIKNGFYDLSKIKDTKIVINKDIIVVFYDTKKYDRKIILHENSQLEYYSFIDNKLEKNVVFLQKGDGINLKVGVLLFSKDNNKIKYEINSEILGNNSSSNIKILSLVNKSGDINIDGGIKIIENLNKINCNLVEESIFLNNTGRINAKPKLLVKSNNVEAKHSCKIEKLDSQKMFYIESRGLQKNEAKKIILLGKIENIFKTKNIELEKILFFIKKKIDNFFT